MPYFRVFQFSNKRGNLNKYNRQTEAEIIHYSLDDHWVRSELVDRVVVEPVSPSPIRLAAATARATVG